MFVNIFDSHTHSRNSFDGESTVNHLCEAAEEKQMMGLCVTDHYECQMPEQRSEIRIRNSVLETAKSRQLLGNRLMLTTGIEIGQATRDFEEANKILGAFKFDFIIGSLHSDRASDDYFFVDFSQLETSIILQRYYEELLELCQWGNFDVLGHLTYPLRYITGKYHIQVDMSVYDELIVEIYKTLISKGKGIEVNTSSLRNELGETSPPLKYLRLFRECGGEIVTIGSDAHDAKDIGAGIAEGMELLQAAGFQYFAFYKKREARMLQLM